MNRRNFLNLTALAACSLTLPAFAGHPKNPTGAHSLDRSAKADKAVLSGSRKKGLGRSTKVPAWSAQLAELRCKWFYSWNSTIPEGIPKGVEFIPMIYRHRGDEQAIRDAGRAARKAGIKELLGFNEPDAPKQGNMSVAAALDAWPLLMETGLRLGSPGCVHPDKQWMLDFMAGVEERKLRVDYICVHSYGGPNAESLVARLERVHKMFKRPLWITEFGVGDWQAKSVEQNRHKPETVLRFMEKVLPMLDKLDYVERYAWFPARTTSIPLATSALHDAEGKLTRLGECYRDA
jgi:hypothetical protein